MHAGRTATTCRLQARRALAGLLVWCGLVPVPARAAVEPLQVAAQGAAVYARACRVAAAAPSPSGTTLARWSAVSDLLATVHPVAGVRAAAAACLNRLDAGPAGPVPGSSAVADGLRMRIGRLEREFERRLVDGAPTVEFSAAEVAGFPPAWLGEYRVGRTGRFRFGVGLADYYPFMAAVRSSDARRTLYFAHANRGGIANLRLLEQIVELRQQLARKEGHASFAHLLAATRGLPAPESVETFLADAEATVRPAADADMRALARELEPGHRLHRWDVPWALERARERWVGQGDLGEPARMPAAMLLPWLHGYFGALAGVRFAPAGVAAWHGSVRCHRVQRNDGRRLGLMCLDLWPRTGKYYNYASFSLPGAATAEPMAVVLANVSRSRLSPDEVERLFGEFSVALSSLTCTPAACDERQQPSLAAWQAVQKSLFALLAFSDESLDVLRRTAGDASPLPDFAAIQANRDFAVSLSRMRELQIARFDHELARVSGHVLARWIEIEDRSALPHERGTCFPGRLNVLASASAGSLFYGLWSEAAAHQLVERFQGSVLSAPGSTAVRAAMFEPAAGLAPEQRLQALAGEGFSLAAFSRVVRHNTIAARAARETGAARRGEP